MDSSPNFVQMCRQAKEIQEQWKKEYGDYVSIPYAPSYGKVEIIIESFIRNKEEGREWYAGTYSHNVECTKDCIWLPRQDQLQAMIIDKRYFRFSLIELFYRFANNVFTNPMPIFYSPCTMERLWLAFVMHHNYKKRWNGSDWVAE